MNLHYVDPDPTTTYMGETRDERIGEFLEENECPVLAMYEGSLLRVRGEQATMRGPARLFRRGGVDDLVDGDDVTPLLRATPAFDGVRDPAGGIDRRVGRVKTPVRQRGPLVDLRLQAAAVTISGRLL